LVHFFATIFGTIYYDHLHPLGMAIERRFFAGRQYSFGDGLMLTNGRIFGLFNGFMIWDLITHNAEQDKYEFSRLLLSSLGSFTGTVLMDRYIRNLDFTTGQAILMATGEFAGVLFGMGTGVILEIDNGRVMGLLALGGGWGGLLLTRKILEVPSENQAIRPDDINISLAPVFFSVKHKLLPGISLNIQF